MELWSGPQPVGGGKPDEWVDGGAGRVPDVRGGAGVAAAAAGEGCLPFEGKLRA